MDHSTINTVNLNNLAYQRLKDMVVNGKVSCNEPLTERALSKKFGMSRTPVKNALGRLQHEGLIRIIPRHGIFTVKKSLLEYQQIQAVREVLEGLAARLAVDYVSNAKVRELRRVFIALGDDIHDVEKVTHKEYAMANVVFHREILYLSKNPKLIETVRGLYDHINLIHLQIIEVTARRMMSISEHEEVIRALEDRNGPKAEEAMRAHIRNLRKDVERKAEEDKNFFQCGDDLGGVRKI